MARIRYKRASSPYGFKVTLTLTLTLALALKGHKGGVGAPLPAALPEPQSSQILRAACAKASAQSPGDGPDMCELVCRLYAGQGPKKKLGSDKTPPLSRRSSTVPHTERQRGVGRGTVPLPCRKDSEIMGSGSW